MQLVIITLAFLGSEVFADSECIRNHKHVKEVLKDKINEPYQMAIEYSTNTLFFSYGANIAGGDKFKIAYLNLETYEFGGVSGIDNGFANAVDSKKHEVYMGGTDGIYKFNVDTKSATKLKITSHSIWQMFYRDGLYFSTYPDEQAYLYKNGETSKIPGVADNKAMVLATSKAGNIFYSNSSGLFRYNQANKETDEVGDFTLNGFSADIDGNLYASAIDGVYYINEHKEQFEKIVSIDGCYGAAIGGNGDIIYSLEDSIVRLKRTMEECSSDLTVTPFKSDQK